MNDYFDSLCAATPARLQIGRTGSRYKTKSYLDFRAAHAAATDAVMTEVSQKTLDKLGLFEVKSARINTKCSPDPIGEDILMTIQNRFFFKMQQSAPMFRFIAATAYPLRQSRQTFPICYRW